MAGRASGAWGVVVWTYVLGRPRRLTTAKQLVGAAVVTILCASVAVPLGMVARLADTQRGLLNAVFSAGPAAAPGRVDAAGRASTSGGFRRPRWNVLLLGSDAGPDRTGARTDTMMVASVDTRTAATTLIGLPRNIQYAPFPPGSPMAARFPDGFHDPRSPTSGDYLLNNVAQYGAEHPDLAPAGPTADRGLNLLLSSVSYMLALPLDHYVEVDMNGLAAIVDALGGVTVDVGPVPLPIGGVTYDGRHVTPDGYVPAGVQHLDGNQALWFARSRRNSDDYDRMARQRCLIGAVLTEKQPIDVITRFRSVATATASSIRTDIPSPCCPRCSHWPTSTGHRCCAASPSTRACPTPRRRPGGSTRPTPTSRSCAGSPLAHRRGRRHRSAARRTGTAVDDAARATVRDGERRAPVPAPVSVASSCTARS